VTNSLSAIHTLSASVASRMALYKCDYRFIIIIICKQSISRIFLSHFEHCWTESFTVYSGLVT